MAPKLTKRLAEIRALLKDLDQLVPDWDSIDAENQTEIIKSVMIARNFLRDVHNKFEWD